MKKAYSHVMRKYYVIAIIASAALMLCSAGMYLAHQVLYAAVGGGIGAVLLASTLMIGRSRREAISKYIERILADDDGISENLITSVPMPLVICSIDGTIRWYNEDFKAIYADRDITNHVLDDILPKLKWSEVLKHPSGRELESEINGNTYVVRWRMLKDKAEPNKIGDHYSVFVYLRDVTHMRKLEADYRNERIDIAVISIDNYDEFSQKVDDDQLETASSKIRMAISTWAKSGSALLKKTDRDRYFTAFEHQYLNKYIESKFDVVEKVRQISAEIKFPLSLSIGIGTGGNVSENEKRARNALDLALGRGGGQVCVKDDTQFRFYGGKNGEYERSSRVKARAVATAFKEFITDSDRVIFMGHKNADYDCFGAAMGLQRAVRALGKAPYIVHERISPAIENMYKPLQANPEYAGMFLSEDEVYDHVTPNTLLVVLDTHRPSMLPCPKLLDKISRVVLIDHHRRSTEFISPCSLIYHEPYASSTCEMVTELIEYMGIGSEMKKEEAHCLYTGILMDTKHFMLKTGVRTFEAASYLRRLGVNTVAVRRMFCTTREDYRIKTEIVNNAEIVAGNIALSKTYKQYKNMRMIASQAADDMLNLEDVQASVVVYPADGGTGFSARSLGSINVQLIMERLGGGGHMTVSGAYQAGITVDEAARRAEDAIKAYLADLK